MSRKNLSLAGIVLVFVSIISCKKSSNNNDDNALVGNWKFTAMQGHTQVSYIETTPGDVYEERSITDYTTTNNSGTVSISSSTMTSTDVSYQYSTNIHEVNYDNGVAQDDSTDSPFTFAGPAAGTTTTSYKLVGKDSIYFPQGAYFVSGLTGSITPEPSGGKYTLNGNTLTITVPMYAKVTAAQAPNDTLVQVDNALATMTFQRQ